MMSAMLSNEMISHKQPRYILTLAGQRQISHRQPGQNSNENLYIYHSEVAFQAQGTGTTNTKIVEGSQQHWRKKINPGWLKHEEWNQTSLTPFSHLCAWHTLLWQPALRICTLPQLSALALPQTLAFLPNGILIS